MAYLYLAKLRGVTEKPLTEKQTAFLGQIASGKTPTQAAYSLGYRSSGQGSRMWNDEAVRETWKRELLDEWGSVRAIVEDVRAGTRAERVELSREGEPVNLGPDHHARAKFLDMILKSMGMYPNPRLEIDQSTQNVLVIDSAKQPLAALDPFASVEAESVEVLDAPTQKTDWNPDGGIAEEDDFLIG